MLKFSDLENFVFNGRLCTAVRNVARDKVVACFILDTYFQNFVYSLLRIKQRKYSRSDKTIEGGHLRVLLTANLA